VVDRHEDGLLPALRVVLDGRLGDRVIVEPRVPDRRLAVEVQRLRDAKDIEADGDAAGEEHAEPREVIEPRLLVVGAELQFSEAREAEENQERAPHVLRACDWADPG
jgi:hypothetical protein